MFKTKAKKFRKKIWVAIRKKPDEKAWVTYAKRQTSTRNNCINLVCTGSPGSGKSWALLSYFSMIDPDFDIERVFFKASELMRYFQSKQTMKGVPFLFDEAGIDANNLKWQDDINRGLNAFFQTGRHRNYIFGMTVPFLNFVSKGVRTLMTCKFNAKGYKNNQTIIEPRLMEYSPDQDKYYYPRLYIIDKPSFRCSRMMLPKPPKQLVRDYEKKKREFTDSLFETISEKMRAFEEKETRLVNGKFSGRQEETLALLKDGKTRKEVAVALECSEGRIYQNIDILKKKGIIFNPGKVGGYKVHDFRSMVSK